MTRGNIIRLPLWLALGMALGLALGPLADSLRGPARTAWAAAGPTAYKYPTAASGTFTTVASGNVYNDPAACEASNGGADTSQNKTATQSETYSAFSFTAADVPANSTINGVTVILAASEATPGTDTLNVQLWDGTTLLGSAKTTANLSSTETLYTLGTSADTWGATVTQALVVSAAFGVQVTNNSAVAGGAKTVSLYCLNVSVAYTPPANIQVADGVAPDGTGTAQGYGASVAGSLAAKFTNNTQTIYAGYIDVTNPTPLLPYGNFDTGYTLANAVDDTSLPADAALNNALTVAINAVTTATSCGAVSGTTVPTQGEAVITQASNTAWKGPSLISTPRPAINTNGASERLCFYLSITSAPDTIVGGSLQYNLTFTAS